MNGHKSSSIFGCFLAFFVLMAAGCAPVYTVKRYGTRPPTIKEFVIIKLQGTETEMVNSGIYLNKGEPYSIVAGGVLWGGIHSGGSLNEGFLLEARIGQEPYFTPLSGTYYSLNGTTRIAHAKGNLYLILDFHRRPGQAPREGEFWVLIIAWKTNDRAQIIESLQRLKDIDVNRFDTTPGWPISFDDAIDRAKKLREDFGFRIPVPPCGIGFAPGIVCVKNYRRVTP